MRAVARVINIDRNDVIHYVVAQQLGINGYADVAAVFDRVEVGPYAQIEKLYVIKGHTRKEIAEGGNIGDTTELEEDEFLAKATSLADPNPRVAAAHSPKGNVELTVHGSVTGNLVIGNDNNATVNQ